MKAPVLGMETANGPLRRLMRNRIFWPLAILALLLLFNLATNPHFFAVTVRGGHLYGSLVDILNRASPLMIIAMGLTLVIATHGRGFWILDDISPLRQINAGVEAADARPCDITSGL